MKISSKTKWFCCSNVCLFLLSFLSADNEERLLWNTSLESAAIFERLREFLSMQTPLLALQLYWYRCFPKSVLDNWWLLCTIDMQGPKDHSGWIVHLFALFSTGLEQLCTVFIIFIVIIIIISLVSHKCLLVWMGWRRLARSRCRK